ncbi:5-formyltetrahydrofolate cyclo-ligase [Paenibacillus lutrae]|uniref:5-formyltetrahydrofolate cyclo-ligase n=1 Tax=Paenibacillus lutrae TaxID=2078573 RepID=A0A7X3FKR7_9BACL|nr:5-formyltetrahydrofolate cyclo-ligase [Paenibacillus lutrae]MVP01440.1 5-formyltetrahydrofolate cyclo-ligase [Paenibacillus lutrae]
MNMDYKSQVRKRTEKLRSSLAPGDRIQREQRINEHLIAWLQAAIAGDGIRASGRTALSLIGETAQDPPVFSGNVTGTPPNGMDSIRTNEESTNLAQTKADQSDESAARSARQEELESPVFLAYVPFRSECDIKPVIEACWETGIRVYVPRSIYSTRELKFYEIHSWSDLEEGMHGILEPNRGNEILSDLLAVTAVLVPGLAFDRSFGRLGYGGGYYDRFLEQLLIACGKAEKKVPPLLAAAFEIQLADDLPMEAHDIRLDVIITESGIYTRT